MSDDPVLPNVDEDEDLDDLPPLERAVNVLLRRKGVEVGPLLPEEARIFAEGRIADAEAALATVPEADQAAETGRLAATVADELADLLRDHAQPDDHDDA